jgi:predicted PurR-regulated permease PerM
MGEPERVPEQDDQTDEPPLLGPDDEPEEPVIESRSYRLDPSRGWSLFATRAALGLLFLAVLGILWVSRAVLVALIFAGLLVFLMEPPVAYLRARYRVPRVLTASVILLLTLTLLVLGGIALAPVFASQFGQISESLREVSSQLLALMRSVVGVFSGVSMLGVDLTPHVQQLQADLQPGRIDDLLGDGRLAGGGEFMLTVFAGVLASLVSGFASFVMTLVLTVVFALYLAHDLPRLSAVATELIPDDQIDDLRRLRGHVGDVWRGFFKGQIVLASIFGAIVALAMWAVGLPAALLMGLIAGLMELVPTLGALIAGGLIVITALVQGSNWFAISNLWFAVLVLALYSVIQWLEGGLLQPRILGAAVRLPGSVAIIGIVIGAFSAGILGAYLAVPFIASGREIVLYFRHKYEESVAKRELLDS